jgi:hypothetical protein
MWRRETAAFCLVPRFDMSENKSGGHIRADNVYEG